MAAIGLAPSTAAGCDETAVAEALESVAREIDPVGPGASLAAEIGAERERARLLARGHAGDTDQRRWFIFPRAYRRLARSGPVPV